MIKEVYKVSHATALLPYKTPKYVRVLFVVITRNEVGDIFNFLVIPENIRPRFNHITTSLPGVLEPSQLCNQIIHTTIKQTEQSRAEQSNPLLLVCYRI